MSNPRQLEDLPFPSAFRPGEYKSCIALNGVGSDFLEEISFNDVHITYEGGGTIRYFGLQSAASNHRTSAALFAILDQRKRRRPPRLSWANSIWKYFRVDPLIDSGGLPMRWVSRLSPAKS